jgi:methylamine utilization protein MauE
MALVGVGCTALVAVVFGFAAVGKLRDRAAWAAFVATTGAMLPTRLAPRPVAVVVAGAEAATAVLAVAALVTRAAGVALAALGLAAVLLAAFLTGIAGVLRSGRAVRCRCFGSSGAEFGRNHLVRNGILLLIVACGLGTTGHPPLDGAVLVAAATGAVCGLLAAYWDELAFLFSAPA